MIACHCTGLSDRRIAAEVAAGAETLEEVAVACGAGGRCGGCHPLVEEIIHEVSVSIRHALVAA